MAAAAGKMTIEELNAASESAFAEALGAIYEHSPWVAERAAADRPFATLDGLHGAMARAVAQSEPAAQAALVKAHPDLGRKFARGVLAPASVAEQAGLGLDRLSDAEFERFEALNTAYRAKFGFPFIIAVKRQTRETVLAAFEQRLHHDRETELRTALAEIDAIARFRLDALLGG